MATHFLSPDRPNLHGHFSRDLPPVLTINSGDTVVFRTLDAGWHLEVPQSWETQKTYIPRDSLKDMGHALCGPVAIAGAEPGMTLEVEIGEIVPGEWGWNIAGGWPHEVNKRFGFADTPALYLNWTHDPRAQTWQDQKGRKVKSRPFMGVMGMPPDEEGVLSTAPPRPTGGNIDCRELVAGTRLFLPIAVPGGLFSTGDGHGAQGDGEVSVTAVECPMEKVTLTFRLHPNLHITTPRARIAGAWLTLGFHEDLDEALFIALEALIDLMQEQHPGLPRRDALALASVAADMRVTQIVNGVKGVHAILRDDAITGW